MPVARLRAFATTFASRDGKPTVQSLLRCGQPRDVERPRCHYHRSQFGHLQCEFCRPFLERSDARGLRVDHGRLLFHRCRLRGERGRLLYQPPAQFLRGGNVERLTACG